MNVKAVAEQVLKEIGGLDNIKHLTHCVTRLRFTLNSMENVNEENLSLIHI